MIRYHYIMTLTKRSKFLLALILISASSLIYIYINLKKTSPPATTTTTSSSPIPQIQSSVPLVQNTPLTQVTLDPNTPFPNLPNTLSVFTGTIQTPDIRTLAQALAHYFHITPVATASVWLNSTQDQFINVSPSSVSYGVDTNRLPQTVFGKLPPDLKTSLTTATQFVTSFPFWSNYVPDSSNIQFFSPSAAGEFSPASPTTAGLIQISFSPTLDNFPLIYSNSDIPLSILIGQNNQIIKISAQPQPISVSSIPVKTYYPLTRDQLISRLQTNQVQVLSGLENFIVTQNLKNYPPITIHHIFLEYRFDPQSRLVSPYFHLIGTAAGYTSIYSTIDLLTPAVATTP